MIAIGFQLGGPEQVGSPVFSKLTTAMNLVSDVRDEHYNDGTRPWVNPILILPGSITKPDFEGAKLGHFSRKQKGLVVMIAVPQAVADGHGVDEFIVASLREAVGLAGSYFAKKDIQFPRSEANRIISAVEAGLEARTT